MTSGPPDDFDWSDYDAVLFDLDGVITPTATIHERAWAELFADYDYTDADYLAYIDGRARYDGVRAFLESRDVVVPEGDATDTPGNATVCALGNRKNDLFNDVLRRDGVDAYPGSVAVLDLLDEIGVGKAIVSSSQNAVSVLKAAALLDRFTVIVDGVLAANEQIAGKPAPDMFLRAATLLGVDHRASIVVEDAVAGVQAGAAGQFGLVIGVDRGAGAEALIAHGADFVVADLDELVPASMVREP